MLLINHSIHLSTQGPIRVLQILDKRITQMPPALNEQTYSTNYITGQKIQSTTTHLVRRSPIHTKLIMKINSIGISVIDGSPQELIYFSMKNILLQDFIAASSETFKLEVGRIQIDSQLWSTPYPAMFYPLKRVDQVILDRYDLSTPGKRPSANEILNSRLLAPFLSLDFKRDFTHPGIEFFPSIEVHLAPFDINIEGTIITSIISFVTDVLSRISDMSHQEKRFLYPLNTATADFTVRAPKERRISTIVDATAVLQNVMSDRGIERQSELAAASRSNSKQHDSDLQKQSYRYLNNNASKGGIDSSLDIQGMITRSLASFSSPRRSIETSTKLYIENLDVSEIRLNFSFNPVIAADSPHGDSIVMAAINAVLLTVGSTIAKIDNCPLKFNGIAFRHEFAGIDGLSLRFATHYTIQALNQVYLILGSSEALGNPVKLVQLISEGLWDFLYLPAVGFITSPEAFWNGIRQGSKSLFFRTVASLCSTAGYMCTSIQVGLVTLGLVDSPYLFQDTLSVPQQIVDLLKVSSPSALKRSSQLPHRDLLFTRPKSWLTGFEAALSGVILEPLKGWRMDSSQGLILGLWRGVIGMFSKPLYGIFGSLGRFLDTVAFELLPHIKGAVKEKLKRVRPPRFFRDPNIPLKRYSEEENIGQELLSRIGKGKYRAEGYQWHCELPQGDIALLTSLRIVIVGDASDYCEIRWECLISQIIFVEVENSPGMLISPCHTNTLESVKAGKVARPPGSSAVTVNIYFLPDLRRGRKEKGTALGLRLLHKALELTSHNSIIDFLSHVIKQQPNLQSEHLMGYFAECEAPLPELQSNRHFASSLRSTGSTSNLTLSSFQVCLCNTFPL